MVSLAHGPATAAGAANDDDDDDAGSIAGHAAAVLVIDLPPYFALLASFPLPFSFYSMVTVATSLPIVGQDADVEKTGLTA